MQPRQYVDLDLAISADGTGYVSRVVDSPKGEASHRFELPFTDVGLENFILKLGHSRSVTRKAHSSRRATAESFGSELYKAVLGGEVGTCFRRSLDEALDTQRALRIRLRIDGAPGLAEIPWEYLYSEGLGRFIAMSNDTPLIRFLEAHTGAPPLAVEPPLRVLVMVSSPSDLDLLDVDREVELLKQATSDLTASGDLELEFTARADLISLHRMLKKKSFHVFHFIGHGVFDPNDDEGYLMMHDKVGRSKPVSGRDLGVLLHDHHSLRLALLNACEGARGSVENPLGGVAQTLIRQGLPAAVAMQFEISDEAALVFAHEFYLALADGFPIEAATTEARLAIFASGNDVEWGTPVLHLRASDGRVFSLERQARPESRLGTLREEATAASAERRFADAARAWGQILAAAPGDETAALMHERASQGIEATALYGQAAQRVAEGDHRGGIAILDQVAELDPDHVDVDGLRHAARTGIAEAEQVEAEHRRQAEDAERRRAASEAEQKRAAASEELGRARSAMTDGDLSDARRRVEAVLVAAPGHQEALALREEVSRRLRSRQMMEDASRALEGQRPEDVVALVEQARELDPDLEDDAGLVDAATWQLVNTREKTAAEPPPGHVRAGLPAGGWSIAAALIGVAVIVAIVLPRLATEPPLVSEDPPPTGQTTVVTETTIDLPPGTVGARAVHDLTIDGDPEDWPSGKVTVSDEAVHPDPGANPIVAAGWLVGWDEAALYVFAQATDESIDGATFDEPHKFFNGDSVHFELGPDPEGAEGLRSNDVHVMLAPVDPANSDVVAAINPSDGRNFVVAPGRGEGIVAAARWLDDGYVVEAAIPWPVLGVEAPEPGQVFGLNLNISDGDGSGGLEQMVSSNPDRTIDHQAVPGSWHTAILLDQ